MAANRVKEQFTTAWDAFASLDDMLARDNTAGRFGWWTNLYQAGVVRKTEAAIFYSMLYRLTDFSFDLDHDQSDYTTHL